MVAMATRVLRLPLEEVAAYRRRSGRLVSNWIGVNTWSSFWRASALKWHAHLERDWVKQRAFYEHGIDADGLQTQFAWPPVMVETWGCKWLREHRVLSTNKGVMESRMHSRIRAGNVQMRWTEAIDKVRGAAGS